MYPEMCAHAVLSAVVANEGQRIDIPDGCILENRLLSGNLNMIVSMSSFRLCDSAKPSSSGALIIID